MNDHPFDHNLTKYQRRIGAAGAVVDVYDVLHAFGVSCPATAHAVKKLLAPGQRGDKSALQDLVEAHQSIARAIAIEEGDREQNYAAMLNSADDVTSGEGRESRKSDFYDPDGYIETPFGIVRMEFVREAAEKTDAGFIEAEAIEKSREYERLNDRAKRIKAAGEAIAAFEKGGRVTLNEAVENAMSHIDPMFTGAGTVR